MNRRILLAPLAVLLAGSVFCRAAVLPPERLFPRNTVFVATVPDTAKFAAVSSNSPLNRLWRAPEMKPFRAKFDEKFQAVVGQEIEKDLGVKWEDLAHLTEGQATIAVLLNDQAATKDGAFSLVLALDVKEHAGQLKKILASVRKKWSDAGKPLKVDKIREYEFTTFTSAASPLAGQAPPAGASDDSGDTAPPRPNQKFQLIFGQVDSLLLASFSRSGIEQIIDRMNGGLVPALAELPVFQNAFNARLRNAPAYLWVNAKPLMDALAKSSDDAPGQPTAIPLATVISILGLGDAVSADVTAQYSPEGHGEQLFIAAPEGSRYGLIKAFAAEAKDTSPPAFIPADAIQYWRWRIDFRQAWAALHSTITAANPQLGNSLDMIFAMAGKDRDDKYDLKSELLDNLGDDLISYEKAPRGASPAAIQSAPHLVLLGSPNPERLAAAFKVGLGLLAQLTGGVKEQDLLGRKIYTLELPVQRGAPGTSISFGASGGYVAFSSDPGMIEEYFRNGAGAGRPFSDAPGLAEARQKIAGGAGFFEYVNSAESMKSLFALLRSGSFSLSDVVPAAAIPGLSGAAGQMAKVKDWADFSLLPPYETVAPYFFISAQSLRFTPEGIIFNYYTPTPPKLR